MFGVTTRRSSTARIRGVGPSIKAWTSTKSIQSYYYNVILKTASACIHQSRRSISTSHQCQNTINITPQTRTRTLSDLPQPKAEFQVTAMGRFSALPNVTPRRGRSVVQRVGSTYGGTHRLEWLDRPRTVLIVVKRGDEKSRKAAEGVIRHILDHHQHHTIIVEEELRTQLETGKLDPLISFQTEETQYLSSVVDFIIALGGDGTLLRVSTMFDNGSVPPVIGINTGTLGFMMPVQIASFAKVLDEVLENRSSMLLRMRLECELKQTDGENKSDDTGDAVIERRGSQMHAMNEITLHRGASPHLIYTDITVDNTHLTECVADGLLVSTPTGSTAYSLSSGGPIVHPSVQSLIVTAIAPRSLSFRTVLLPSDVVVRLNLSKRSRSNALLSLDGSEPLCLQKNQTLLIKMSPFPVPCIHSSPISRLAEKGEEEKDFWIEDIRGMLKFNSPFREGQ